jgi:hypothetical protein
VRNKKFYSNSLKTKGTNEMEMFSRNFKYFEEEFLNAVRVKQEKQAELMIIEK